ncbi:biliverdin-producing heme oxygenase [Pseudoalteromonas sp. DL2-H2.2]|uniref:biliverdin-producing heme oxygenase n=1 Tax=Pseudoalteromonas sp. DL2-H2.2 TaxID=2908889 RepID=UPI001F2169C8|nr:biliverdin-producing heme oxygenase [Pseudoalteromonas sp. DL2-H2.2]MCF2907582.1 biliverdin-producing heme oxygenase [Pseudoalteromonas sp. DL2-H2.2]
MSNLRAEHYPRMSKLRISTSAVHDQLDKKIMDQSPFASQEHYGLFLRYQYHLMNYVASLYQCDQLALMINNLKSRDRTEQLLADFQDLDMTQPAQVISNTQFSASMHESLGWLYVVEGSKLGAAVLAKEAEKLGLHSGFGARFLAGSGADRGSNWRQFMQDIEALTLTVQQEQEMLNGAQAAFKFANQLVELSYNQAPNLTTDVA